MKFLLVLVVVLFGVWLWKHNRQAAKIAREAQQPRHPAPAVATPAHMVACAYCGLHLPQHETVTGARGHYCSDAHRAAQEG
jgi:uncharacterized protein